MKLEDQFFQSFFYPFFISIILCTLVVTLFLGLFINNNHDKRTFQNIINSEKKYSLLALKSANILLTTTIEKIQASLNEQILSYQMEGNKLLQLNEIPELNNTFLKCALTLDLFHCFTNIEETYNTAIWLLDNETTEYNIGSKKEAKLQLITYSHLIHNIDSCLEATKPNAYVYSFYFEKNELYISYPIYSGCETGKFYILLYYSYRYDSRQCMDENAEYYNIYKFKCEIYFRNFLKSKTNIFDYNYSSKRNKTIFISNYYAAFTDFGDRKFTMCIEFDDPITKGKGYACSEVLNEDLVLNLENLNSNLAGYYFISIVGFNNVFYFPQGTVDPKTSTQNIFKWDFDYELDEKSNFFDNIRKIFTSNYIDYLNNESTFEEIFINGKNSSGQYFFINGEKYKYSIYPVIFDNLYGEKEHIFSIIYIYNEQLFFQKYNYYSSLFIKIILMVIVFIIFGFGLLYIIYLTFNALSKHIVIPIKNINYMLKGIHIGGMHRLEYLKYLNKKQDENIEKLEKILNKNINESNNNLDNNTLYYNKNNNKDLDKEYDEESNYISKEFNFYDFDDQLLQYRPFEIDNLIKKLMNLKKALILTSEDRGINKIINYSFSEEIFKNLKNREGAIICQSNMGNLQSQLLKYDKAIYHLVLSLQDNKLKRFLSRNLSDEFDEGDVLLNQISNSFHKRDNKEKINKLMQKQINSSKEEFSQKSIGILINTRYCRLVHTYYMFFKNLQKIQTSNDNFKGQFMNTLYHTITYYHKILIQYIYLSYFKNDLVKIGESILNYIEFLIKFKLKTSPNNNDFLKYHNKDKSEYKEKQNFKKYIFNKILNWFNLFEDYISYVKDNSSLNDIKSIVDVYSHSLNSENEEFNWESQSAFMFRINIQKYEFLKGKFCLCCKNYNDALFYFIQAAKKERIIYDGLIKKKSLKHIFKIMLKVKAEYENAGLNKTRIKNINNEIKKIKNNKNNIYAKKLTNKSMKFQNKDYITLKEEIDKIKKNILQDINECKEKKEKDILILIDFNLYNNKQEEDNDNPIDIFIEQTILILNKYLAKNDKFCVFVYTNIYKIICPLMNVVKIDSNNFSKDLINYKNIIYNNKDSEENNISFSLNDTKDQDLDKILDYSEKESLESSENENKNYEKINGLIKSINYLINYSKMKEGIKKEKYFLLFTDLINLNIIDDKDTENIFKSLKSDKDTIFILIGKKKQVNLNKGNLNVINYYKKFEEIILNKFGEQSEIIEFENMKKIKAILSNNNIIKDEIIYPNEIYK